MLRRCCSIVAALAVLPAVFADVQLLGSTLAGTDFGCRINETCPHVSARLSLSAGQAQIRQAIKENGINVLRIRMGQGGISRQDQGANHGVATSWQFLANSQPDDEELDPANLSRYDGLIQACLNTGAYCIVNPHELGSTTNDEFAEFWGQLARRFAAHERVIFEFMSETRHVNVSISALRSQRAVTAIRKAGATSQMILLPGIDLDNAAEMISSKSVEELLAVKNPDGSTDKLLLNFLDDDQSETSSECPDNAGTLALVAKYLSGKGRKAFISETRALGDASCRAAICVQTSFINDNEDVFTGLIAGVVRGHDAAHSKRTGQFVDPKFLSRCHQTPQKTSQESRSATRASGSVATVSPTTTSNTFLPPVFEYSTNLILTDALLQNTDTMLQLATGTPSLPYGTRKPVATPSVAGDQARPAGLGTLALWMCAVVVFVSFV